MKYYPAFLDLKYKKAVVIGGGKVAERKVRLLITAGATVKLISPDITTYLHKLAEHGQLRHVKRSFRKGDTKGAFIVIAGTSSTELNAKIAEEAQHLVNVVDTPSEGNYIVPSIVKRGPLTIAISTEGASPALSKAIRKELESYYGREFARYLGLIELLRKEAMKTISDHRERRKFLKSLASEELLRMLRTKGFSAVKKILLSSLNVRTNG